MRSSFESRSRSPSVVPRRVESFVGLEAATAYHNQQAAQRPAGGAYYEAPREPFVHIIGPTQAPPSHHPRTSRDRETTGKQPRMVERSRSASSDSSVSMHFGNPARTPRHASPPPQPRAYTPTRAPEDAPTSSSPARLALPTPVYRPGSSAVRNGRSPLARKSFTRFAMTSPTGEQTEIEVRVPRRASEAEEEERRGRRGRRSVSVGGRGRRRLSKQRKESR